MFNFFKKNKDHKKNKSALEDAKKIVKSISKESLQASWTIYHHVKKEHTEQYDEFDQETYDIMTRTWGGLHKLIEFKGDFTKFSEEDKHFLFEIRDGHVAYSDVLHVLIDHHDDKLEADYVFKKHPDLHKIIPREYDNTRQVIEFLIEIVKDYQWQLEHFAMAYYGEIEDALGEDHEADELYVMPN